MKVQTAFSVIVTTATCLLLKSTVNGSPIPSLRTAQADAHDLYIERRSDGYLHDESGKSKASQSHSLHYSNANALQSWGQHFDQQLSTPLQHNPVPALSQPSLLQDSNPTINPSVLEHSRSPSITQGLNHIPSAPHIQNWVGPPLLRNGTHHGPSERLPLVQHPSLQKSSQTTPSLVHHPLHKTRQQQQPTDTQLDKSSAAGQSSDAQARPYDPITEYLTAPWAQISPPIPDEYFHNTTSLIPSTPPAQIPGSNFPLSQHPSRTELQSMATSNNPTPFSHPLQPDHAHSSPLLPEVQTSRSDFRFHHGTVTSNVEAGSASDAQARSYDPITKYVATPWSQVSQPIPAEYLHHPTSQISSTPHAQIPGSNFPSQHPSQTEPQLMATSSNWTPFWQPIKQDYVQSSPPLPPASRQVQDLTSDFHFPHATLTSNLESGSMVNGNGKRPRENPKKPVSISDQISRKRVAYRYMLQSEKYNALKDPRTRKELEAKIEDWSEKSPYMFNHCQNELKGMKVTWQRIGLEDWEIYILELEFMQMFMMLEPKADNRDEYPHITPSVHPPHNVLGKQPPTHTHLDISSTQAHSFAMAHPYNPNPNTAGYLKAQWSQISQAFPHQHLPPTSRIPSNEGAPFSQPSHQNHVQTSPALPQVQSLESGASSGTVTSNMESGSTVAGGDEDTRGEQRSHG